MKLFLPETKDRVYLHTDSFGCQKKYKKDNIWYKEDTLGGEGIAEELSSVLLSCSILPPDISFVHYKRCMIGNKEGCESNNFLKPFEQFISLKALYINEIGGNISDRVFSISNIKDRFEYIVDFVKTYTNLDITDYLRSILTLDMIICNPDRHYGNLGVIKREDNTFRLAPIFDNGQGLSQNFTITPPILDYEEKLDILTSATISGSFISSVRETGGPAFFINYPLLYSKLENYPNSIAKEFLINQLSKYEKMIKLPEKEQEEIDLD